MCLSRRDLLRPELEKRSLRPTGLPLEKGGRLLAFCRVGFNQKDGTVRVRSDGAYEGVEALGGGGAMYTEPALGPTADQPEPVLLEPMPLLDDPAELSSEEAAVELLSSA